MYCADALLKVEISDLKHVMEACDLKQVVEERTAVVSPVVLLP